MENQTFSPRDFAYWLQGYFEIAGVDGPAGLTEKQVRVVKDHLQLVFNKETPDRSGTEWDAKKWIQSLDKFVDYNNDGTVTYTDAKHLPSC